MWEGGVAFHFLLESTSLAAERNVSVDKSANKMPIKCHQAARPALMCVVGWWVGGDQSAADLWLGSARNTAGALGVWRFRLTPMSAFRSLFSANLPSTVLSESCLLTQNKHLKLLDMEPSSTAMYIQCFSRRKADSLIFFCPICCRN